MLIAQILYEDIDTNKIVDDLMDFLLAYRQAGIYSVPIDGQSGAIEYLRNLGNDIDDTTIDDLCADDSFSDIIERTTDTNIEIKPETTEPVLSPDQEAISQEKVDKTAAKVAKQAVKAGEEI